MARVTNKAKVKRLAELRIMGELLEILRVNIHEPKVYDGITRAQKVIKDEQSRVLALMREEY